MKKLISLIAAAAAAAALLTGCTAKNNDQDVPQNTQTASAPDSTLAPGFELLSTMEPKQNLPSGSLEQRRGQVVYWDTFRTGGNAGAEQSYKIFTSYTDLKAELGEKADSFGEHYTEKAFDKIFVVAVYTTVNTGGFTFGLNSAEISNGVINIDLSKQSPEPGAMVTQAFEKHCVLIGLDSKLYSNDLACNITVNGEAPASAGVGK